MNDISYIFKKMWQKILYRQDYLSIFWADNVVDSWVVDNRGITRGYDDYFYMFPWKNFWRSAFSNTNSGKPRLSANIRT